ncbi:TetR/AcrR family transcriptional regulator [Streptomyces sp. MBT56]|uniref:TetR/AcrR family transcriptional regulator n=1 Tax=unclassified Streptomyces TaxID=2593676 RepID=UPI00190C2D04|nr:MULTISPECIES: TetR/AcrR family transcriptional regulator [unclassified Streptomyces]MBK3561568.1 TetR/AcrR family transcriptional regulator [Streptomyces sp. MBT56]MBK3603967.1 TetR/AcrR family transcriptional regulator [Streptomyces sp. MBT54]MBK3616326.1 TetR/AcrR family transcriptional regulator [Streptomyces sp. MBT98]
MSTIRGARERARIEVTAAIKDEARKQLAEEGAPKLSLRAVARELGMVSSALYRYFPSRDDLLTALIVDAFDAIGAAAEQAAAEQAVAEQAAGEVPPAERWVAVSCAVREWALAHPHEYALIYGSPVPGYIAPMDTVGPAARVGLVLIDIVRGAFRAGDLTLPPLADELRADAERMAADFAEGVPPESVAALVAAWAQLFGLISFELFGQYNRVVEEREALFRQTAGELARSVGLRDTGTA